MFPHIPLCQLSFSRRLRHIHARPGERVIVHRRRPRLRPRPVYVTRRVHVTRHVHVPAPVIPQPPPAPRRRFNWNWLLIGGAVVAAPFVVYGILLVIKEILSFLFAVLLGIGLLYAVGRLFKF